MTSFRAQQKLSDEYSELSLARRASRFVWLSLSSRKYLYGQMVTEGRKNFARP